ncbi:MAG TPA: putative Ig domain-containing protein [Chitinophagaceae bacterium]
MLRTRTKAALLSMVLLCSMASMNPLRAQDSLSAFILTPKAGPEPHINGSKVFGVRPGHPIVFTIPVSGNKPVSISATDVPKGVKIDVHTGALSGSIEKPGEYVLTIHAKNAMKEVTEKFTIVVGENIVLTPPMGWNSWNIYGTQVTQDLVLANAKAMVSSGLADHGWTYMNIDDAWQGSRGGPLNAIQPASVTFPDVPQLSKEVHGLGLKLGIYSTPWVESYGHHVGGSAMNPEGTFEKTRENIPRNKKMLPYAIGTYSFVSNDVKQYVQWNIDYLKYDWNPNELPETKAMYDALRASGRDIALSLSNSTPFASIGELSKVSNCWRTGGDIRDNWKSLKGRILTQDKWAPYAKPGHWNDPDMMVVGYVGWGKGPRPTQLTADEQYTHVSAWCLMSVPLLLGCDLTKLDAFTISLLTNDEVLAVSQDPLGKQATLVAHEGETGILAKDLSNGTKAAGLFNTSDSTQRMVLKWQDLGIQGKYIVRDIWRQKDLGSFTGEFAAEIPLHGVLMLNLRKEK